MRHMERKDANPESQASSPAIRKSLSLGGSIECVLEKLTNGHVVNRSSPWCLPNMCFEIFKHSTNVRRDAVVFGVVA